MQNVKIAPVISMTFTPIIWTIRIIVLLINVTLINNWS